MSTLENTIQKDLVQAMKDHQEHTVSALRSVKTAIMEVKTAPGGKKELEDGDIIKIIQKLVKQRKESMVRFFLHILNHSFSKISLILLYVG